MSTEKEEWLKKIQEITKKETIEKEELDHAKEVAHQLFECPLGFNPFCCDGKQCSTDNYNDCNEFLKAKYIIIKVLSGEILVNYRSMEVPL